MILAVYIAVILALGVLVMMRREITNGFFRWRDYFLTAPLLYISALILLWLDSFVATLTPPSFWIISIPLRALIGFGILVVVWGGTLTAGALILRLLAKPFQHT
ncbi:hypothetical protein [Kordiimonas aquimaris]|uniref:hypothetical protein n=1 Tax=Kordiimonas aquimaris TaxID=707591 RepID=UPI0021D3B81B|nr:hypothetical protein [Kordiimonas aquimaris]